MSEPTNCPKCTSPHVYSDGALWTCPECFHEWQPGSTSAEAIVDSKVKDAHGTELATGDAVTVIKDLKLKGSSSVIKGGTKVRNIRILDDAEDGHNIACKIDGIGSINLKSEFVKKA